MVVVRNVDGTPINLATSQNNFVASRVVMALTWRRSSPHSKSKRKRTRVVRNVWNRSTRAWTTTADDASVPTKSTLSVFLGKSNSASRCNRPMLPAFDSVGFTVDARARSCTLRHKRRNCVYRRGTTQWPLPTSFTCTMYWTCRWCPASPAFVAHTRTSMYWRKWTRLDANGSVDRAIID
ncbi:hypothetical protein H310_01994 [Aphanomyces invadans]|uniref:Uncharacterized protein n=1 Tax=Aphanomyces invadans TaxID=157072 RepID=A0A024UM24_9STRA|nr:hypothetical protein H310_01994 [Aphanomyces invadans]ETW07486.1 hypothetical protein H310_01994 [Aphanomyces invadans]|eukprot:XP_008863579.1 hypothetical protein H310_01994 [Aphanomyces invadans]